DLCTGLYVDLSVEEIIVAFSGVQQSESVCEQIEIELKVAVISCKNRSVQARLVAGLIRDFEFVKGNAFIDEGNGFFINGEVCVQEVGEEGGVSQGQRAIGIRPLGCPRYTDFSRDHTFQIPDLADKQGLYRRKVELMDTDGYIHRRSFTTVVES